MDISGDGVTSIIHMGGRIYDPEIGRFVQADPIVEDPRDVQTLNRYSYVLNNPLSYTDPTGYICDDSSSVFDSACGGTFDDSEKVATDAARGAANNSSREEVNKNTQNTKPENTAGAVNGVSENTHDGTYFFGGAGMDGEYINDMASAFEKAGISDVHPVNS